MSALPPKADITERNRHVRFVPIADIRPSRIFPQNADATYLEIVTVGAGRNQPRDGLASRGASAIGLLRRNTGGPEICRASGSHSVRTNRAVASGRRRAWRLSGRCL